MNILEEKADFAGNGQAIEICLNGKVCKLPGKMTVKEMFSFLQLNREVVVEVNREIIPKTLFSLRVLENRDVVEIVHFVGGG